jgi:hypothetical protein
MTARVDFPVPSAPIRILEASLSKPRERCPVGASGESDIDADNHITKLIKMQGIACAYKDASKAEAKPKSPGGI